MDQRHPTTRHRFVTVTNSVDLLPAAGKQQIDSA
jgi:hypothetical protein